MRRLALLALALAMAGCQSGNCGNICTYRGLLAPQAGIWTGYGTGTGAGYVRRLPNPFFIPSQASSVSVNYVYTSPPANIAPGAKMALTYSIDGDATFAPVAEGACGSTGCGPALLRLFVWENGDVGGDTFRWWCTTAAPIVIGGNQALACQLTPGNWSDVNGQNGSAQVQGFNDAIANPFAVGFTFGGMYAGHGVQVTGGQAMFKVNSFTIQLERK
jgi:hypothetical protein